MNAFVIIAEDENNIRLDRWLQLHYPSFSYIQLQKLLRTGQIRVNSKRAKSDLRVIEGDMIRLPPMLLNYKADSKKTLQSKKTLANYNDLEALKKITLYEDKKILVINKPHSLAVQGGSGVSRHIDAMLDSMRNKAGVKPRLVHRLDRDTSGVLVIAKTRQSASFLAQAFKERNTQKIYWALVVGVPKAKQGKISTWLVKYNNGNNDIMKICDHGTKGADHAVSYYKVIETAAQNLSWLEMQPLTGRTHQLRVHADYIKNPILGDPKYFTVDQNWSFPGGLQNKLHLHARRIIIPHPDGGNLDITAPLPLHMKQSFNLLGFDKVLYQD